MEYYYAEDPSLSFYQLFRRISAAMHRERRKELRKYRVSDSEVGVLFFAHASNNSITPAGISKQMVQDNHATTQLINRMEKRGLLKKVKDLPRANMVRVVLTKKGELVLQNTLTTPSGDKALSALSSVEKKHFVSYLHKVWVSFENIE
jgi:DNA-binding MarR family transcriptional regulator